MLEPNALKSSFGGKGRGSEEAEKGGARAYHSSWSPAVTGRRRVRKGGDLPPSCIAQALGIHLAHIAHTDDANRGILLGASHPGNDSRSQRRRGTMVSRLSKRALVVSTKAQCMFSV